MSLTTKSLRSTSIGLAVAILVCLMSLPAAAQVPEIVVRVDTVNTWSGVTGVEIPVYLENYTDSIAGVELWLMANRPDIFEFQTFEEPDGLGGTVTSVVFDTSGTLISGWQGVAVRSIAGSGYDAKIVAIANTVEPPMTPGIGYPQTGEIPLIKLVADIYDLPAFLDDSTAQISILYEMLDNIGFSDPQGNALGIVYDSVVDTTCFECVLWLDPPDNTMCGEWSPVSGTIGDSCAYDTVAVPRLDTAAVEIINGLVDVNAFLCADANNNGQVNILDVTYLIAFLYQSGPAPVPYISGDADGSGAINILDVTYLINYLYNDGPEPVC